MRSLAFRWVLVALVLAAAGPFFLLRSTDSEREPPPAAPASSMASGATASPDPRPRVAAAPSSGAAAPGVSGQPAATDPAVWRAERTAFLRDKGYAAAIQRALGDPTAARLFYALKAVDRCGGLQALGAVGGAPLSADGRGTSSAFATVIGTCNEALTLNGDLIEFFAKLRAARLGPEDQAIFDAVEGSGGAKSTSMAERFATVAATDDPLLMAELGSAWTRSPNARFAGQSLTDDTRATFAQAWELAACEATGSCDALIGAYRMCSRLQQCSGTFRSRIASVLDGEEYAQLVAYTQAVTTALRSKDFSSFSTD